MGAMTLPQSKLFGSPARTAVLIAIRLLGDTYPTELARLLGLRLFSVQGILAGLEAEGVIASRDFGRSRRVTLDPRFVAHKELAVLLAKLGRHSPELQTRLAGSRRRPRRPGKPGL
jgi:DNA-binding IclR family transcriptional regulator